MPYVRLLGEASGHHAWRSLQAPGERVQAKHHAQKWAAGGSKSWRLQLNDLSKSIAHHAEKSLPMKTSEVMKHGDDLHTDIWGLL